MLTPEQKLELIKYHFPSDISMWAVDGKFPSQSRLIDEAYAAGAKDMQGIGDNMNTSPSLYERTLKAMIESRDDVADSISEIPPWKADYERRVAQATAQLAEHDACIKDLEAAIAEQTKLPEKEYFCFCDKNASLQMVSGGAAKEGYLGRVTLKIDDKSVDYIRAEQAKRPTSALMPCGTAITNVYEAYEAGRKAEQAKQARECL